MLITIAVIVGAALLRRRAPITEPRRRDTRLQEKTKWEPYEDEAEPLEGKGGSGPGAGAFSIDEDD